jgi:hypothetical protein
MSLPEAKREKLSARKAPSKGKIIGKKGFFSMFALNGPPQGGARAACAGGAFARREAALRRVCAPRSGAEAPQAPDSLRMPRKGNY